MDALSVYQAYVALKTHFTEMGFDYFKNHAQNTTLLAFNKRKDRIFFERIAERYPINTPKRLIIANLVYDPNCWPQAIASKEGKDRYVDWQRRQEAIYYNFEKELDSLLPSFDENVRLDNPGTHPYLLKQLIKKSISIETAALLVELTKAGPYWEGRMKGDIIWDMYRLRVMKYPPFLSRVDRGKLKEIMRGKFQTN